MAEYIDRTQIKWYGCDHEGRACIPSSGHCEKCFFGTCNHDEVMSIKPADVAPIIHAEWAHQYDDYFDWWECTNCGYGGEGEMQFAEGVDVRTNYCPNCGAKMDKEY